MIIKCSICKEEKLDTNFYRNKSRNTGYSSHCKKCDHNRKPDPTKTEFKCCECKEIKSPSSFYSDKSRWSNLSSRCILCEKKRSKRRKTKRPSKK